MKCIEELANKENYPALIAMEKKPERRLLSVFLALLDTVPLLRGKILEHCNYRSGRSCQYFSVMEPSYLSHKYLDGRPDGLISCTRGTNAWSALVEAKAGNSEIRPDQIQGYCELASQLDIPAVISISNQFGKDHVELPYHLSPQKRKKREVYHFAWAELRTLIVTYLDELSELNNAEKSIINHALRFMWSDESGITTYDAMPANWPKFVQSSGTELGFGTNTSGVTEIVHGWQQERRDLLAKLILATRKEISIKHAGGARTDPETRVKYERNLLANEYLLQSIYVFKQSKAELHILSNLRGLKTSVALDFLPPENKKAKASVSWLIKAVEPFLSKNVVVSFDWKGRADDTTLPLEKLMAEPSIAYEGQSDAPKTIRLIREVHDVRRFKSRTKLIEDLESTALDLVSDCLSAELL